MASNFMSKELEENNQNELTDKRDVKTTDLRQKVINNVMDLNKALKDIESKVTDIVKQISEEEDVFKEDIIKDKLLDNLIKEVDKCQEEINSLMAKRRIKRMNELLDKSINEYKNRLEAIVLEKKFDSIQEFQSVLKVMPTELIQNIGKDKTLLKAFPQIPEQTIAIYFGRHNIYYIPIENKPNFNKMDFKPNCIAIDDKVMVGSEAKQYYQRINSPHIDFDIKTLLGKNTLNESDVPFIKKSVKKIVCKSYNNLEVNEFNVESLIGLQVLDIKNDVQNKNLVRVKKAVFTVPTHFNIKQRNAMKDIANIAGFDSVEVLTEISSAALAYRESKDNKELPQTVLFIVINDYRCDAALVYVHHWQMEYETYFHKNLTSKEISDIMNSIELSQEFNNLIKETFKDILAHIRSKEKLPIVIIGSSEVIPSLKVYIKNRISSKFYWRCLWDCDPIRAIVNGSALYGLRYNNYKIN